MNFFFDQTLFLFLALCQNTEKKSHLKNKFVGRKSGKKTEAIKKLIFDFFCFCLIKISIEKYKFTITGCDPKVRENPRGDTVVLPFWISSKK